MFESGACPVPRIRGLLGRLTHMKRSAASPRRLAALLVLVTVRGWTSPQTRAAHRRSASLTVRCSDLAGFVTERFGLTEADAISLSDRVGSPETKTAAEYELVCDSIQSAVSLTDKELKRIVERVPQVLDVTASDVEPSLRSLTERLSLSDIELKKKVVLRVPQCLGLGFDEGMGPTLAALQRALDLSDEELRKLVLGAPQVLGLDFETEVAPKIAALQARVGSLEAAKAEALRQPSSLELPVIGSKVGAQERGD